MDEHVEMSARAARAARSAGARPDSRSRSTVACEIGHAQRDVMQSGAALFEKFRDGRIGSQRFEQLDARIAGGQHRDVDFLVLDGFAMVDLQARVRS